MYFEVAVYTTVFLRGFVVVFSENVGHDVRIQMVRSVGPETQTNIKNGEPVLK